MEGPPCILDPQELLGCDGERIKTKECSVQEDCHFFLLNGEMREAGIEE